MNSVSNGDREFTKPKFNKKQWLKSKSALSTLKNLEMKLTGKRDSASSKPKPQSISLSEKDHLYRSNLFNYPYKKKQNSRKVNLTR